MRNYKGGEKAKRPQMADNAAFIVPIDADRSESFERSCYRLAIFWAM